MEVTHSLRCPSQTWYSAKGCDVHRQCCQIHMWEYVKNKHYNEMDLFNISWRVGRDRWPLVPDILELSQAGHPSGVERISISPGTASWLMLHFRTSSGWGKWPSQNRNGEPTPELERGSELRHIQKTGQAGSLAQSTPWWINWCTDAQERLQACKHLHA